MILPFDGINQAVEEEYETDPDNRQNHQCQRKTCADFSPDGPSHSIFSFNAF